MNKIPCDKIGDLAKAAEVSGFHEGNIEELIEVVKTFADRRVFAEALRYVERKPVLDGVARGVRPPHTSKRTFNDPLNLTNRSCRS